MKGTALRIRILMDLALLASGILTLFSFFKTAAESWSQNALTYFDPLLHLVLGAVSAVFVQLSLADPKRKRKLLGIRGMQVRFEHIDFAIAIAFLAIACTPVTLKSTEALHLMATGTAISMVLMRIALYHKDEGGVLFHAHVFATVVAVLLFFGGYKWGWYTIAMGEFLVLAIAYPQVRMISKKINI